MNTHTTDFDELCPACKFGIGRLCGLVVRQYVTMIKLRCDHCGREWGTVEPLFREKPSYGPYQS